jgi:hypothetical protein
MGASSWRELLGRIIADPQEKQRVVNELGVNPITLIRWVKGEVVPRDENLRRLLEVLPAQREALAQLLMEAFPTLVVPSGQDMPEEATRVPAEFYSRILNIYVTTPPERRFWSVSDLTIQLALGQLDPNYLGMAFVIAQCMPPAGATHKIRSLRQNAGRGTPPWNAYLEQEPLLLGAESLAGYAVTVGHLVVQQSRAEQTHVPARWVEWEESAVACPIFLGGRIAGCVVVSSTQPGYFLPFRQRLIEKYAELLTLACRVEEFYALEDIELKLMPSPEVQKAYFVHYRQRVSDLMQEASRRQSPITIAQAERIVWEDLETELSGLAVSHY